MKTLSNLFISIMLVSCSHIVKTRKPPVDVTKKAFCTVQNEKINKFELYELGDLPCLRYKLKVSDSEYLKIDYITLDKNAEDIYKRGYQVLKRVKNNKTVEVLKLRKAEDAYWSETPFVRVREQKYFADLDGDGYLEFAVFPFSPGSAIVGTVRIFSLKNKIVLWGKGRYQFEGDTFVRLNCPNWSKFNPSEVKNCE